MPPQPLESVQNSTGTGGIVATTASAAATTAAEQARGGSISLAMLIDFIIQRTYHELTVLAEL